MILLKPYSKSFENEYWNTVYKKIDTVTQTKIINSCKKFLPPDFFIGNESDYFKSLILAPYKKIKVAEEYISMNTIDIMEKECFCKSRRGKAVKRKKYKEIYDAFEMVVSSKKQDRTMRVRIVENANLTVCPYCNRDYINCRATDVSGAQLDHFYSRSEYPLFAVCLYNLVPVCSNCNRVKSNRKLKFVSPFDNSIDWQKDISFTYTGKKLDDIKIVIEGKGNLENNITGMRIDEAYQIHGNEILDLIERQQIYNESQKQEIKEVLSKAALTDLDIKRIIFGPQITQESMRNKPLGKMLSDLHKELKIY